MVVRMYYIIVYDVGVEKVAKLHKYLRTYLTWVQNSVFEGELGDADILAVKKHIKEIIDSETDSVLLFRFRDRRTFEKEVIGKERNSTGTVL